MKFCEYCGSENNLAALQCKFCAAPFSVRAVRITEEIAGDEVELHYPPQLGQALAPLFPIILAAASIGWVLSKLTSFVGWCRA